MLYTIKPAENRKVLIYRKDHVVRRSWIRLLAAAVALACVGAAHGASLDLNAYIYDPRGEIATAYGVVGMPSAVLLDRAGHVCFQHVGFSEKRKDEYETHVRSLLGEPVAH
jgi:hypothetical protein